MKNASLIAIAALTTLPGLASADCSNGTRLNRTQMDARIPGFTVCAMNGTDKWQEQHVIGGQLWDYKKGPSHPVDPSKQVGTWSIQGSGNNATITYSYGSSSYTYSVHGSGPYSFCNGGAEVVSNATFIGGTSCGF